MRTCGNCGISIEGKRANAKYCSTSCRVLASRNRQGLPEEMKQAARWVRWKRVARGNRFTKAPITVQGRYASSTDPRTWTSWDVVRDAVRGDGPGFVLGDGFACIDLDHCLNGGRVSAGARRVLDSVGPTFVEVSPSGDGLHVWVKSAPRAGRVVEVDGQPVEVYSSGRYMTVTGVVFSESVPAIADVEDVAGLVVSLV